MEMRFSIPETTIMLERARHAGQMPLDALLRCFEASFWFQENGDVMLRIDEVALIGMCVDFLEAIRKIEDGVKDISIFDFYGGYVFRFTQSEEGLSLYEAHRHFKFKASIEVWGHIIRSFARETFSELEARVPDLASNPHFKTLVALTA